MKTEATHHLTCPLCNEDLVLQWENAGVGFGEPGFSTKCPRCSSTITNDTLCCAKFCADLKTVLDSPDGIFSYVWISEYSYNADSGCPTQRHYLEREG